MDLLLVDDEQHIIDSMMNILNWDAYGIENIYTANSLLQAKKIMEREEINLMVCDIEMPGGSGLKLLEWERKKQNRIEAIFLTGYAEFEYAKEAIHLGGLEFLLKPMDYDKMAAAIEKATERVRERKQSEKEKAQYKEWENTLTNRKRVFWENLFLESAETDKEILEAIKNYALPYEMDDQFIYVIVDIYDYRKISERLEHKMISFVMENITEEIFSEKGISSECISWSNTDDAARWNVVLKKEQHITKKELRKACESYISLFKKYVGSSVSCYLGSVTKLSQIQQTIKQVLRMHSDSVTTHQNIFFLEDYRFREIQYNEPAFYIWESLLEDKDWARLENYVRGYLEKLEHSKELNKQILKIFRADFTQMVYKVLVKKNINSYQFFEESINQKMYTDSLKSIDGMKEYSAYLIKQVYHYTGLTGNIDKVILYLKEYIDEHLSEDFTRDMLADIVYFNPDYLANVFAKKEGVTLGAYLNRRRMERAKELLRETSQQISKISLQVGFPNSSYFTKKFKEYTEYTPNEYRKRNQTGK